MVCLGGMPRFSQASTRVSLTLLCALACLRCQWVLGLTPDRDSLVDLDAAPFTPDAEVVADAAHDAFVSIPCTLAQPFETIEPVSELNTTQHSEFELRLSPDRLRTFFTRSDDGALNEGGARVLFQSSRTSDQVPFGNVEELGAPFNLPGSATFSASLSPRETIVWFIRRDADAGASRLWRAQRSSPGLPFGSVQGVDGPQRVVDVYSASDTKLYLTLFTDGFGQEDAGFRYESFAANLSPQLEPTTFGLAIADVRPKRSIVANADESILYWSTLDKDGQWQLNGASAREGVQDILQPEEVNRRFVDVLPSYLSADGCSLWFAARARTSSRVDWDLFVARRTPTPAMR